MSNQFNEKDLSVFTNLNEIQIPKISYILARILVVFFGVLLFFLCITPWRQTAQGAGYVIAINPNERAQSINAPVSGRIKKWYVSDGAKIKAGEKLVEIVDNDPEVLEKLEQEKNAEKNKYNASQLVATTAKINYDRQRDLFKKGLSSRKEYEDSQIKYTQLLAEVETAKATLINIDIKLSRQSSQVILAPDDGIILNISPGYNATFLKVGDQLATFAPDLREPAVELYVRGNDIPLVIPGRQVRLQFEGFPIVQFSGWPALAIGTFGGIVSSVDSSISKNGRFRVIIKKIKNEKWPDERFLRHGVKVNGWIILNEVKLGYEIWRQLNAFPPEFDKNLAGDEDQDKNVQEPEKIPIR
jgi:multidrug efflux pump subunit AcrA (membrane-fusion protein)